MSDKQYEDTGKVRRRTVLKSAAAASTAGLVGVPTFGGTALAQEADVDLACDLDIMCAVDASGSLDSEDTDLIEEGVNAFIDELGVQAGDSIRIGSLQFAGGAITRLEGLQSTDDLTVSVDDPGGDTPMPGALDIADQILYNDPGQRDDADKLIVIFTDGGPNYELKWSDPINYSVSLNGHDYVAPRDQSTEWSAVDGNDVYDNDQGSTTGQVSEGEMDETAAVADSIMDSNLGGGSTAIAAIYVDLANDLTNAMTSDAINAYTDLPTYLEGEIVSSSELFLQGDTAEEIAVLGEDLAETLEANCCTECDEEGALAKYEFECVETVDEECVAWDFTLEGEGDSNIAYTPGNFTSKGGEENEPMSVTFNTDYCELYVLVKSGQELEVQSFEEIDGSITVGTANDEKYAISFVEFYCDEDDAEAAEEEWENRTGGNGGGKGGK